MSEIKITLSSLENGIFRDGQIVSGYVSDNSEIKSSDKGAHAEGYATSNSSIISSGLGSIAAGFVDEYGTIKSNSRGSIAIGCADGDGSEYSLISANEKGSIAMGSADNNSSINAFGVGSIALGHSSDTASINSNGSGAFACGYAIDGSINASGNGAHAEGINTLALANGGHAEGSHTKAIGINSHVEGESTIAFGAASHAEGYVTNLNIQNTNQNPTYVEGYRDDKYAYTYGFDRIIRNTFYDKLLILYNGLYSRIKYVEYDEDNGETILHIEPKFPIGWKRVDNEYIYIVGRAIISAGTGAHVEGMSDDAPIYACGLGAHAEGFADVDDDGRGVAAIGIGAHAEGNNTYAGGDYSHAEGCGTEAFGVYSHAEGGYTEASGTASHAEGQYTTASGYASHAEGILTESLGTASHAEGSYTQSLGNNSHVEGEHTRAKGNCSHAEGYGSLIRSTFEYLWSAGENSAITEDLDHILMDTYIRPGTLIYYGQNDENPEELFITEIVSVDNTTTSFTIKDTFKFSAERDYIYFFIGASADYSHTEGYNTAALATASHASGTGTLAIYTSQTVVGRYNNGIENALFIVGNGLNIASRNNALAIYVDGHIERTVTPKFPGMISKTFVIIDSEYDGYAYGAEAKQNSYLIWDNVIWAYGENTILSNKEILYIRKHYANILLRWGDGDSNLVFSSDVYKPNTSIIIKTAKGFGVNLHGYRGNITSHYDLSELNTYKIMFGDNEYPITLSTSLSGYKIREISGVLKL